MGGRDKEGERGSCWIGKRVREGVGREGDSGWYSDSDAAIAMGWKGEGRGEEKGKRGKCWIGKTVIDGVGRRRGQLLIRRYRCCDWMEGKA